jgi:hypothetical protein
LWNGPPVHTSLYHSKRVLNHEIQKSSSLILSSFSLLFQFSLSNLLNLQGKTSSTNNETSLKNRLKSQKPKSEEQPSGYKLKTTPSDSPYPHSPYYQPSSLCPLSPYFISFSHKSPPPSPLLPLLSS